MIHIKLVDLSAHKVEAMRAAASVSHGDLVCIEAEVADAVTLEADAIASPANSFGFMDGGIDLAYSHHFGWPLQTRVQQRIREETIFGELLVGEALCVPTGDPRLPNLIVAPTMRVPSVIVDPNVVFMATRAAVRRALDCGFVSLILPGMGTGTGHLDPEVAARQMVAGINEAVRPTTYPASWWDAHERHFSRQ